MPHKTTDQAVAPAGEATGRSRPNGFAHFTVLGRLATNAELRFTPTGTPVCHAVLAVNAGTGQAHYLDVTLFGEGAKVLAQYGTTGRTVAVHGRISTHSWTTDDGARRKVVDLVADDFHFADRAPAPSAE